MQKKMTTLLYCLFFFRIHMLQPPTAFTEIVVCLRQFHPARTTDELNGLCLLPCGQPVTHPTTNTVKCCLTSEILRMNFNDPVYRFSNLHSKNENIHTTQFWKRKKSQSGCTLYAATVSDSQNCWSTQHITNQHYSGFCISWYLLSNITDIS